MERFVLFVFSLYLAFAPVGSVYAVTSVGTNIITGGNVGIGTTNPIQKLEVIGSIKMVDGSQGSGKYLTSDANGLASWGTISTGSTEAPGQIVAFATTCPTGWTEYTAARGRTIVGTPASGTNAGTVGTALTDLQDITHTHSFTPAGSNSAPAFTGTGGTTGSGGVDHTHTYSTVISHTHTVDPANTSLSISDPGHTHALHYNNAGGGPVDWHINNISVDTLAYISGTNSIASSGTGISGTVDIGSTTSSSTGSSSGTSSGASAYSHTHSFTPAGSVAAPTFTGTGGTTGTAATSSVMPYIQLTYCQKSAGADLAEWINSLEVLTPGTVVSIDHNNNEKIVASNKDYDSSVAGVISTKPGWLLGEEQKGNVQLALSGRVPVRVTTANGEIKRGDPITTSSIRGVGMLATKSGKIIGIAMEPMTKPYGTITVLLGVAWNDSGDGSVMVNTTSVKPGCGVTVRGTIWVTRGEKGVKDTAEICLKDAGDDYAWRLIY